jgi:hypothetical protein
VRDRYERLEGVKGRPGKTLGSDSDSELAKIDLDILSDLIALINIDCYSNQDSLGRLG